jgi:hypothetical protein
MILNQRSLSINVKDCKKYLGKILLPRIYKIFYYLFVGFPFIISKNTHIYKGGEMKFSRLTVLFTAVVVLFAVSLQAQQDKKPRASLHAKVSQTIGIDTEVTIDYSRPGVKGRKIFGELVPFGMEPGNKYSNEKPFPWRGGANENTTIEFSKDVSINGNKIAAGKYSLHFIPGEKEWVVIFNKNNKLWGSYQLNPDEDVLRITVASGKVPPTEWLTYGFDDLAGSSCTAYLQWEETKVPFKIEAAN